MKDVYLAAALFSVFERQRNSEVATMLEARGMSVFLPQQISDQKVISSRRDIFTACLRGLDMCRVVVGLVDGADVDSGTAWELGYAYAKGKPSLCLRTDFRLSEGGPVNIMIEYTGVMVCVNSPTVAYHDIAEPFVAELERLLGR